MSATKKIFLVCGIVLCATIFLLLFSAVFGDANYSKDLMSQTEATNFMGFPLVDSATNIYGYLHAAGLQEYHEYLRFTVAKSDVTNQLNLAIADNNRRYHRALPYQAKVIDRSKIMPAPSMHWWQKPVSWWSPEKITNGFFVGENDSYAYQIWIDKNTGTIFIYQSD
jgi:hypothetical protein